MNFLGGLLKPIGGTALVAQPVDLRGEDLDIEEQHAALAAKLGAFSPSRAWRTLAGALAEEMIPVYDLEKVTAHMDKQSKALDEYWFWHPLRAVDVWWTAGDDVGQSSRGQIFPLRYREPVPLPVLMTVDRLVERLGEDAQFFVAALGGPADPFLAVRLRSDAARTIFVIERWDEPGFRS